MLSLLSLLSLLLLLLLWALQLAKAGSTNSPTHLKMEKTKASSMKSSAQLLYKSTRLTDLQCRQNKPLTPNKISRQRQLIATCWQFSCSRR